MDGSEAKTPEIAPPAHELGTSWVARHRVLAYSCGALALLAIVLRVVYLVRREIVVDEFQHLHAAFLVSQGKTPYVDFFAHHVPAAYFFLSNVVPFGSPSFDTILEARGVALAFNVMTVLIAFAWMRSTRGRPEALVAVVLFVGNLALFHDGSITFLDTYAAPLLLFSGWMLATSRTKPLRSLLSGAAMAMGILVSQKLFLVGLVPLVWFGSLAVHELGSPEGRRQLAREFGALVLGGAASALAVALLLGAEGVAGLWRDAVALNLRWEARHRPTAELRFLMQTDGLGYVVAAIGAASQLVRLARRRFVVESTDVASLFGVAFALGLVVLPVVWGEYFVAAVPFALLVASETLVSWWQRLVRPRLEGASDHPYATGPRFRSQASLVVAAVLLAVSVGIRVYHPTAGKDGAVAMLFLAAALGFLALGFRLVPRAFPVLLLVFLVTPSVAEQIALMARADNDVQRARVEFVMEQTAPDDPVFDGYSGYGVFRPHAYEYWFLHDEVRLILTENELGPDVITALREEQPPIVIVDHNIEELPQEVLDYIDEHYESTPYPEIRRLRRGELGSVE